MAAALRSARRRDRRAVASLPARHQHAAEVASHAAAVERGAAVPLPALLLLRRRRLHRRVVSTVQRRCRGTRRRLSEVGEREGRGPLLGQSGRQPWQEAGLNHLGQNFLDNTQTDHDLMRHK